MLRSLIPTIVLSVLVALGPFSPADAHHARALSAEESVGVPIANLTHGQMRVMAKWHRSIQALADKVLWPDRELWALVTYEQGQRFWCGFGLMPGSVEDEASPFNECSHAYLAADREILLRIAASGNQAVAARRLKDLVSLDMASNADALIGCQYSAEGFNTAGMIYPDMLQMPLHAPTALVALLIILGIGGTLYGLHRLEQRFDPSPPRNHAPTRDAAAA